MYYDADQDKFISEKDLIVSTQRILLGDDENLVLERGTNYALRITTESGWGDLGAQDSAYFHIKTDRARVMLDKELRVDTGYIGSLDEDLNLRRAGSTKLTLGGSKADFVDKIETSTGGAYGKGAICGTSGTQCLNFNDNGWVSLGNTNGSVYGGQGIAMGQLWSSGTSTLIGTTNLRGQVRNDGENYGGAVYFNDNVKINGDLCLTDGCRSTWPSGADGYLPDDPATSNVDMNDHDILDANNIQVNNLYDGDGGSRIEVYDDFDMNGNRICLTDGCRTSWPSGADGYLPDDPATSGVNMNGYNITDVEDLYLGADASDNDADMYIADRIIDWDSPGYYVNPAGTNRLATVTADRVNVDNIRMDGDTITFYRSTDSHIRKTSSSYLEVMGSSSNSRIRLHDGSDTIDIGDGDTNIRNYGHVYIEDQLRVGASSSSSGSYSVALGRYADASGDYSLSQGYSSRASGSHSVAIGRNTDATTTYATAIGYDADAGSYMSTALGPYTDATNSYAVALGYDADASGYMSHAMGPYTRATSSYSLALGYHSNANGYMSTAIGREAQVSGTYSIAISLNDQNHANLAQSNTMAIMGGRVGIGTRTPSSPLEVDGNVEINGDLCLTDGCRSTWPTGGDGYLPDDPATSNVDMNGYDITNVEDISAEGDLLLDVDSGNSRILLLDHGSTGEAGMDLSNDGNLHTRIFGYDAFSQGAISFGFMDTSSSFTEKMKLEEDGLYMYSDLRMYDHVQMRDYNIYDANNIEVNNLYDGDGGSQIEVQDNMDFNWHHVYDVNILKVNKLYDAGGGSSIWVYDDFNMRNHIITNVDKVLVVDNGILGSAGLDANGGGDAHTRLFSYDYNGFGGIRFGFMDSSSSFTEKMRLTEDGLSIGGPFDSTFELAIGDSDTGFNWGADGDFYAYTNGAARMRWHSDGNTYMYSDLRMRDYNIYDVNTIQVNNLYDGDGGSRIEVYDDFDMNGNRICLTDGCRTSWPSGADGYLPDDPATSDVDMTDFDITNLDDLYFNGGSRIGDYSGWLRINSGLSNRIYTPNYFRVDDNVEINGNLYVSSPSHLGGSNSDYYYVRNNGWLKYLDNEEFRDELGISSMNYNENFARRKITSNRNYWTGAKGWGSYNLNTAIPDFGSGFWDAWSNPSGEPGGGSYSHYVGLQAYHYWNGNSGYGWQMSGTHGPKWWLRYIWGGGWSSWYEVITSYNIDSYDSYLPDDPATSDVNMNDHDILDANNIQVNNLYDGDGGSRIEVYDDFDMNGNRICLTDGCRTSWPSGEVDDGYKFPNREESNYKGSYKSSSYTYLLWDRNNGGGPFVSNDRPQFFYWDNDDSTLRYLIDSGNMKNLNAVFNRIQFNGNSGIRTSSNEWALYTYANSYTYLYYNGGWRLRTQSNGIRSNVHIYADNNVYASAFYYSSDRSLKTNIKPLEDSTQKVMKLEGVSFNWKEDGRRDIGLIAQDVAKIFPEAVAENEETGLQVLDYGHLVAPLVEATKEQQEELTEHERELRNLQIQINKLKQDIKPLVEATEEQQKTIKQQKTQINQLKFQVQRLKQAETSI